MYLDLGELLEPVADVRRRGELGRRAGVRGRERDELVADEDDDEDVFGAPSTQPSAQIPIYAFATLSIKPLSSLPPPSLSRSTPLNVSTLVVIVHTVDLVVPVLTANLHVL